MLKKCLKYDLAPIARIWWILAVTALGAGMIGSIAIRLLIENFNAIVTTDADALVSILAQFSLSALIFVCALVIAAFPVVTVILVYVRYFKNFFTDEGYLTFTLPVPRRTLYLSKVLNALIWMGASILVLLAVVAFGLLVVPVADLDIFGMPLVDGGSAYRLLFEALTAIWEDVGAWMILYLFEGLLLLVTGMTFTVGLVNLCLTFGATIAKKHKLLAAIGVYYGVNMILSALGGVLEFLLMIGGAAMAEVLHSISDVKIQGFIALLLLMAVAAVAVLALTVHYMTLGTLERKLNLA